MEHIFLCSSIPCPLPEDFAGKKAKDTAKQLVLDTQAVETFYYSDAVARYLTNRSEHLFTEHLLPVSDRWATKSSHFTVAHDEYKKAIVSEFEKMPSETWEEDDAKIVEVILSKFHILRKFHPLQKSGYLPTKLNEFLLLCPSVCNMVMASFLKYSSPIRLVSQEEAVFNILIVYQ